MARTTDELKQYTIQVRVSEETMEQLRDKARSADQTVSAYVREIIKRELE